jgi:hypothetical protein
MSVAIEAERRGRRRMNTTKDPVLAQPALAAVLARIRGD